MNLLPFSLGLILGVGAGVGACFYHFVIPLTEHIKTLGETGSEEVFDSLPVEPIQINDNTIYTVMGGSERIH
jgi:hypothetical protein